MASFAIGERRPARHLVRNIGIGVVSVVVLVQAYIVIGARPDEILSGVGGIAGLIARGLPPDPSVLGDALGAALVTLDVAIVGTAAPILISLLLAFWAAGNVTPGGALYSSARGVIAFFRVIPDVIWALLFVAAVGLGPFAGTLGLAVHTIGVLGRLYAEAIEDVDMAPIEALTAMGASRFQIATHAVLPSVLPTLTGLTLYRMDTNVRSSLVLGFVGGGGLGLGIETAINLFAYQRLLTYLLVMGVLVVGVEVVAVILRRRIQ
jgi:phosphonate transport system permease protein